MFLYIPFINMLLLGKMLRKKYLKRFLKNILNFRFLFDKPVPIYTKYNAKGVRLHLGCGDVNLQGWINIDARFDPHIHIVSEGLELSEFSDDSISEIYMCHVLEHFSFEEGFRLIQSFKKKLKNGGILRLSVPDFDSLVEIYKKNKNDLNSIRSSLMGGQNYEFNYHKWNNS